MSETPGDASEVVGGIAHPGPSQLRRSCSSSGRGQDPPPSLGLPCPRSFWQAKILEGVVDVRGGDPIVEELTGEGTQIPSVSVMHHSSGFENETVPGELSSPAEGRVVSVPTSSIESTDIVEDGLPDAKVGPDGER